MSGANRLLLIAIDEYVEMPPLRGPNKDADALRGVLFERYGFRDEHTVDLRNEEATTEAIQAAFRSFRDCPPEDNLVIYYGGHGYTDSSFDETGYWIPHDAESNEMRRGGWLPNTTIRGNLRALPFNHVLLICDSCFSGDLLDERRNITAASRARGYPVKAARFRSREVLTSGASEPVTDLDLGGHSAFAFHLVDTLRTAQDDWIDGLRLYDHVRAGLSSSGQSPLYGGLAGAGHQSGGALILCPQASLVVTPEPPPEVPSPPQERMATLVVRSAPPGAQVAIDGGRWVETTPTEVIGVPWGLHHYRATLGQRVASGSVDITDYEHVLDLTFDPAPAAEEPAPEKSEGRSETIGAEKTTPPSVPVVSPRSGGRSIWLWIGLILGVIALAVAAIVLLQQPKSERTREEKKYETKKEYKEQKSAADPAMKPAKQANIEWVFSTPAGVQFARTETTVAQYRSCVDAGECESVHHRTKSNDDHCNWGHGDRDDHPMNCVDWDGAKQFCDWAGGRLPTEQEWESEASAGGTREYPWGDELPSCSRCVMDDGGDGCGRSGTWPVCSKRSGDSTSGLCDMGGNVWEWTDSWYDSENDQRVLRGGSWVSVGVRSFRASARGRRPPDSRNFNYGFRCVVSSQ
ncbi:MAG: SUMF1/EgtB/PvdO family nonheme iron enzyme [Pseudomonadota bacterium]